jgi:hypothetical protein
MRPANIYDVMIGRGDETQMTGLGSHRPLFTSRHATATLKDERLCGRRFLIGHDDSELYSGLSAECCADSTDSGSPSTDSV